MLRRMLILVLILVFAALGVWAQESNDPNLSEDANACSEGGTMEGKCNVDFNEDGEISDFEVRWAWECGWYMIRYDAGIFSEVPSRCQSLIPPVVEVEDEVVEVIEIPLFCYWDVEGDFYIYPRNPDGSGDGAVKPAIVGTRPDYPVCTFDPRR